MGTLRFAHPTLLAFARMTSLMFRLVAKLVLLDSGLRQNDGWEAGTTGLPVPGKAGRE